MKTLLYARVSTITQGNNQTIESQIDDLKQYCQEHSIDDYHLYQDTKSGASKERIIDLIKYLKDHKPEQIVFTYLDRIARDVYLQLFFMKECKMLGIELISTKQPFLLDDDDPFKKAMLQIVSVFSELEKNLITARMSNGRKHKAYKGIKSQGTAPLGYKYEGKGKDKRIVIDAEESKIVKEIFSHYNIRRSFQKTADHINVDHTNRDGKKFTRQSIRNILQNKFYTGILTYNGKEIQGQHKPLISKNMFTRINS